MLRTTVQNERSRGDGLEREIQVNAPRSSYFLYSNFAVGLEARTLLSSRVWVTIAAAVQKVQVGLS